MDSQKQIILYHTVSGRCPFAEWLREIPDNAARVNIQARIQRASWGHVGDCKSLGDGLYELRIHKSPGFRVLICLPRIIYLTPSFWFHKKKSGFSYSTSKTIFN